jgi:hypothetical protein
MHCTHLSPLFAVCGTKTHSANFQGYLLDVLVRKKNRLLAAFLQKENQDFCTGQNQHHALDNLQVAVAYATKIVQKP